MSETITLPEIESPDAPIGDKIDRLEFAMSQMPQLVSELEHIFMPGLYMRKITMPAGGIFTSKVHRTEHPFVVLSGRASVMREDGTWEEICAPHMGITKPGTRRVLAVHDECVWVTFHPTTETDLAKIEQHVIEPHDFMKSLSKGGRHGLG